MANLNGDPPNEAQAPITMGLRDLLGDKGTVSVKSTSCQGTEAGEQPSRYEVVVYHDETGPVLANWLGHVLFFVPTRSMRRRDGPLLGEWSQEFSSLDVLYHWVLYLRQCFDQDAKLHFSDISGRKWYKRDIGTRCISDLAVDALRHRFPATVKPALCCKLAIIFYPRGSYSSMFGGADWKEKRLRQDETLLRMLLKGGLHYLYDETNEVVVTKLITDGQPSHRPLDPDRVLRQIQFDEFSGRTPLRDYVTFSPDAEIVHMPSHHKHYAPHSDDHKHANMLQVADLLLGSVIRACHVDCTDCPTVPRIGTEVASKKDIVAYPVKEMLEKTKRGRGFEHSGHYKSFSVSHFSVQGEQICFQAVRPKDIRLDADQLQLPIASNDPKIGMG